MWCSVPSFAQTDWSVSYKNYTVEVILQKDSVSFSYEVDLFSGDEKRRFTTSSLDSFLILMGEDLDGLADEEGLLFYFHGMFGGQRINYDLTLVDFRHLYVDTTESRIGRLIGYRWPGNNPAYLKDKQNAHMIASALSQHFADLVKFASQRNRSAHVITHSLGSELFKEMLFHITELSTPLELSEVVICAPDLDDTVLEKDSVLHAALPLMEHLTVYYSNKDFTLTMSKTLNKKNRLGLNGPSVKTTFSEKVTYVNVSLISDEKFLPWRMSGHSYIRGSRSIAADILSALNGDKSSVPFRKMSDPSMNVYELQPRAKS